MAVRHIATLALLGAFLTGCFRMDTRSSPAARSLGKEAPGITGIDSDGTLFRLSDYRGKVVLLDFWSTH